MWCSNCQQDVPAIATPEDGKVRCTKCRCDIAIRSSGRVDHPTPVRPAPKVEERQPDPEARTESQAPEVPAWAFVERPPIDLDAWRWDPDLLDAQRVLHAFGPALPEKAVSAASTENRIDPPHPSATGYGRSDRRRESAGSIWVAVAITVGVVAILGGGLLLGWGLLTAQDSLWWLATCSLIGGETAVIAGLLLQLAAVSRSHSAATATLDELDEQIEDLRRATSLFSRSRGASAPLLYSHLATGSSSRMLLADLKCQIDRLARKFT